MSNNRDFDCILLCEGSSDKLILESYLKFKFKCELLEDIIKVSRYKSDPYDAAVMSYPDSKSKNKNYKIAVCSVKGCTYFNKVIADLLEEIKNDTLSFKHIFILTDNDSKEETKNRLEDIVLKINEKASSKIKYGIDCIGKWESFSVKKSSGEVEVNLSFCYQIIPDDNIGCIESLAFENYLFNPDFCKKHLIDSKEENEKANFLSEWPKSKEVVRSFVDEQLNKLKYLSKRQNNIKAKFNVALSVIDPKNFRIDVSEIYDHLIKDNNEEVNRILKPLSEMFDNLTYPKEKNI
jgi:hypothetical protein